MRHSSLLVSHFCTFSTHLTTYPPNPLLQVRDNVAYDITGQQKIVVRGSFGLFFDRPDGQTERLDRFLYEVVTGAPLTY